LKLLAAGAKSFIVDVRNNPGGYVGGAVDIAEQLMPAGPIVHFQQQGEIVETYSANGTGNLDVPVVLLINEGSASASEILAAAWQDSGTAILVGMQTYGKGVAQQIIDTAGGGKAKLSMYYFLSPNKDAIDRVGVKPDYIVRNYTESDVSAAERLYDEYKGFAPMTEKSKPSLGDTGLNVFGAQQRLSLLGYGLKISGTMDGETAAAVKAFQAEQGLFPYGVLDYSTMNALDKAVLEYITGAADRKDLQLEKAIELLK
jgi:carboxyl-terminal processing protease